MGAQDARKPLAMACLRCLRALPLDPGWVDTLVPAGERSACGAALPAWQFLEWGVRTHGRPVCHLRGAPRRTQVVYLPPISMLLQLPTSYPSTSEPLVQLHANWLTQQQAASLEQGLKVAWEDQGPGAPVVFLWAEWLRSHSLSCLGVAGSLPLGNLHGRPRPVQQPQPGNPDHLKASGGLPSCEEVTGPGAPAGMAVAVQVLRYAAAREGEAFRQATWTCSICYDQVPGGRMRESMLWRDFRANLPAAGRLSWTLSPQSSPLQLQLPLPLDRGCTGRHASPLKPVCRLPRFACRCLLCAPAGVQPFFLRRLPEHALQHAATVRRSGEHALPGPKLPPGDRSWGPPGGRSSPSPCDTNVKQYIGPSR